MLSCLGLAVLWAPGPALPQSSQIQSHPPQVGAPEEQHLPYLSTPGLCLASGKTKLYLLFITFHKTKNFL